MAATGRDDEHHSEGRNDRRTAGRILSDHQTPEPDHTEARAERIAREHAQAQQQKLRTHRKP